MLTKEQSKNLLNLASVLESGRYKQGKEALRKGNDFCCLGVACDIFKLSTGIGKWLYGNDTFSAFNINGDCNGYTLHNLDIVKGYFGFKHDCGIVLESDKLTGLTDLNDSGKTFIEIAEVIRSYVKKEEESQDNQGRSD